MITKDQFIELLRTDEYSEMEIVEKYIMFGTPYIFMN
jgi:hypothetical protein